MAEERLEGTDIGAALEEVGGEGMSEGVAGGSFWDVGFADGVSDLSLQGVLVEVVPGEFSGSGVWAEFGGWEDELPGPFARGVWGFAGEGSVHVNFADAGDEVEAVFFAVGGEVGLKSGFEGFGEWDESVFAAFGVVDGDGAVAEVDVFDAEAECFHDAETGAVEELGGEFPGGVEKPEHGADFLAGEDGGWAAAAGGGGIEVQGEFRLAEDVAKEEDEGVEGLFLGGGRDLAFEGEELDVGGDGMRFSEQGAVGGRQVAGLIGE